ncbi:MAG: hypothetical protein AAB541_02780 [Patescibacteria group bacterium]
MNKVTSIVEINGNRYDAVSGRLIGVVKKAAHQVMKPTQGLSIDGFTRRTARAGADAKRSVHELKRRPEHSKTLMRSTVKKPARAKLVDKIQFRGLSPDHARADRARRVPQSSKVQRFGLTTFSRSSEAKTGEVIKPSASQPIRSSMAASATMPSVMTSTSHYKLERLLDYALTHADAHKKTLEQSKQSRRKLFGRLPRWLGISLLILIALAATGFIIWRQVPAASFKLAATKAHVNNASLPKPILGYKIGAISVKDNSVVTTVQSTTDSSKKYTVAEQASNQPEASLAASATTETSDNPSRVQTVQDQDKTYVLSQNGNKSTAVCTKGTNTVRVEGVDLTFDQLLAAAKNACKSQ